jgi:hypothetical protein
MADDFTYDADFINDYVNAHNRAVAGDPPEGVERPASGTLDELLARLNDADNAAMRHFKAERQRQFTPQLRPPREY